MITSLSLFHASAFFKSQLFLLPVLYLFYLSNGLTLADYFLFQGLIVLLNVFLQIPMGYLGDKFARKTLLITSYILFLGRIILWYFFQGYWIVFLGELLYACSKGMFDAIESPYIYDLLEKRGKTHKMVRAYSKLNCALSSGTALAAILGSWMYDKLGLHLLLLTEFIFISCAILFVAKLPKTDLALNQNKGKNAFEHIKSAFKGVFLVFQKSNLRFFVLFSACLNACSHFFFWSFQPLMKLTLVPIALFGTVLFVNNVMRSVCALYTEKIIKILPLKKLGILCFSLNSIGFFIPLIFIYLQPKNYIFCLAYIFFLCCAIVFQLMFTISHVSRLQQLSDPQSRTQIAAGNMMTARLFIAICLILPKYFVEKVSLELLFIAYGAIFFLIAGFILLKLQEKNS